MSSAAPPMYYCHECAIQIRPLMVPDPTCPRCNGGFVEEVDESAVEASREDDDEDADAMQLFGMEPARPFMGAAGRSDGNASPASGSGMDFGTLMGGILRGLATAGSQPRTPAADTSDSSSRDNGGSNSGSNPNGTFRSGSSHVGPVHFSWSTGSFQSTQPGSTSTNASSTTANQAPFTSASPMGLNEFVRRSFENDPHHHDDGMGGAGGAADGRFFNMDNQNNPQPNEEQDGHESDANNRGENTDYPPELASIRDVFANIFGGMGGGDGPASMLIDLFGGGGGRGRTGDYVWGQQGLDDVITQLMEQTRGSTAPPPATEEAIRKLERFSRRDTAKVNQARNRECSTCMDSFQEDEEGTVELSMDSNRLSSTLKPNNDVEMNDDPPEMGPTEDQQDEVIMMPCKHLFHVDCLLPWLKTNGTCPVCRVSLEPKEQDKKQSQSSNESNRQGEASSAVAAEPSSMDVDNDEDESVEAIRGRSRRAAENRMMGGDSRSNDQNSQRVPGSFLQPDELD